MSFLQFQPQLLIYLVIIVVLFVVSAMVSGSETAFFSLTAADVKEVKNSDSKSDSAIIKLLGRQDSMLAAILIVNNLVNICIVILSNIIIDRAIVFSSSGWEFTFKLVTVTFTLLLFAEIMPKIFGAYNPLRFTRFISIPILALQKMMTPFSFLLIRSSSVVNEKLSRKKAQLSIGELSDAMSITKNHSDEERKILSGIVSFVNTEVVEIMVLRIDIVGLDMESDFDQVKATIIESGLSRIPIYKENIDNIIGILYVKDMTPYISQPANFGWQEHLRTPYFVPERKKISDLLEEFQASKVHMAIVVDEYGATQGLVSLEDILEEIVGDINDESDPEQQKLYKKIDDNTYIFEGKAHVTDFLEIVGINEDYFNDISAEIETLAGLMLELNNDFLAVGETISSRGVTFTVVSLDKRRIDKVKVVVDYEVCQ